jgi:hypothetical protein
VVATPLAVTHGVAVTRVRVTRHPLLLLLLLWLQWHGKLHDRGCHAVLRLQAGSSGVWAAKAEGLLQQQRGNQRGLELHLWLQGCCWYRQWRRHELLLRRGWRQRPCW